VRRLALAALLAVAACAGDDDGGRATTTTGPSPTTTTTTAEALDPVDAADGVGDPYFPELGGAGTDVEHYDLALTVPADGTLIAGVATLTITATDDLASFTLDLLGFDAEGATVDGEAAAIERDGRTLRIRPKAPIRTGRTFETQVRYAGPPQPVTTPPLGDIGWLTYPGGSYVIGEPEGAATWFPADDHPQDKATFRFEIVVPDGVEAVANGVLVEHDGGRWVWEMREPMATYLASVAVGQFTVTDEPGPGGVTIRNAFADRVADRAAAMFADQPAMLAFFAERFGPFPFDAYGALVVEPDLGLALESQTLSLFGAGILGGGERARAIIAHELAHQWFGDSVTPADWRDIWLSEGFATYAQWLWTEHDGGPTLEQSATEAHRRLAEGGTGDVPPGDPGPDQLFHPSVYDRGALALLALRRTVGDEAFGEVLRRWASDNAGGTVTTADFVALAEAVSGRQLDALFDTWLYAEELPPLP